jgi:choline dehydrogenase-like flavoprotein
MQLTSFLVSRTFDEKMWLDKTNKTWLDLQYAKFIANRTGYYTVSSDNHMILPSMPMLHGNNTQSVLARFASQDVRQFLRDGIDDSSINAYRRQLEITLESLGTDKMAVDEKTALATRMVLVKPLSRGFVQAQTVDIWDPPAVNHRTLSHPLDLENVVGSLKLSRKIMATPEMAPLNPIEISPGPQVQSDDEFKAFIRNNLAAGGAHGCCSAPMGTVLDSSLRVKGVNGLRVVDTSSWPMIPGAHSTLVDNSFIYLCCQPNSRDSTNSAIIVYSICRS